jgi:hypothetical protein
MIHENEIAKIVDYLKTKYPDSVPNSDYDWKNPALNILDCVLSLNRKYNEFVKPRINYFRSLNPKCYLIEDLLELFNRHSFNFEAFTKQELNYNHAQRGELIFNVCKFLLKEISRYDDNEQLHKLRRWAIEAKPGDSINLGIHGFGLSGFQYLRMLYGAQTAKPDRHIRDFISEIICRKVNDVEALELIERASNQLHFPLRDLDYEIWKFKSGSE